MKKITALIPFMMIFIFMACNKEEDKLSDKIDELESQLDSSSVSKYKDSLNYLLALSELDYKKFKDSLTRADSLNVGQGILPFAYNIVVYDGSTTSVFANTGGSRTSAFDAEVTVSISQFGETRTITTTDGLASFDDIGRGIVKVSVTAPGYTTLKFSFETLIDPSEELYEGNGSYETQDFWNFVKTGNIGHDVAIFATTGTLASTLSGRAFVELDLTNGTREVVPEGTVITAAIDVENGTFQDEFILYRNKQIFTDNILSFGYDPNFSATVDANGDFTFTLAGAANEMGLPYHFDYSDFLADQLVFIEDNSDVTTETDQTVFGPEVQITEVPNVTSAPTVAFVGGSGATANLTTSGDGSLIDIDVVNAGQNFQGVPRVIIPAPAAGGTPATATATIIDGRIDEVTLTANGLGYTSAVVPVITEGTGAAASVTALTANSTNGGVATVTLQNSGNGFVNVPNVIFSSSAALDSATIANYLAGLADAPTATATLNSNGTVANINVTNSGSDLGGAPSVIVTSGFGAVAQVTAVTAGAITGITIINNGDFYTNIPTAVNAGGNTGTGATFTITLTAGQVASIATTAGGAGYVVGDQFNLVGVGSGATATAVYQGESIEDYNISNAGNIQADGLYYSNTPAVVFPEPEFKGVGSVRATGTAVLDNDGRLIGINITNVGSGYTAAQLILGIPIAIVSGSGATATSVLEPFKITEIDVTNAGSGYVAPPLVRIYDNGGIGSGATATAVMMNGQVTSITLTNEGANYTNPEIRIVDPGNSYNPSNGVITANPARAEVEVTDGVITAITMIAIGDSYQVGTTGPNVVLTALRGTGFTASANVANGQITSVTVNTGGNDYVSGNTPGNEEGFEGIEEAREYYAKTSITRIRDIYYGTGARRNGNPAVIILP